MPHLEPTYLRYVFDGLNKGTLNAENAAALPRGFIGIYEQKFAQKIPVSERKIVLDQLALWVSASPKTELFKSIRIVLNLNSKKNEKK